MVGQGLRTEVRQALQAAKVVVTREGYTDSSTTTWGFVVRTRKTIYELQNVVWNQFPSVWCYVKEVKKINLNRY